MASTFVARWSRVSAHLAAGLRLRALGGAPAIDDAPAVLSPSGRLEHASGDAAARPMREALRDAARAMDRARGKLRREDPDRAVTSWASLVRGEYTLVDSFDSDGRRFLVACPNSPAAPALEALTLRERQAVALRAAGHPLKFIAYELGLSQSAISRALERAMRKLGVRNAIELVERYDSRLPFDRSLGVAHESESGGGPS